MIDKKRTPPILAAFGVAALMLAAAPAFAQNASGATATPATTPAVGAAGAGSTNTTDASTAAPGAAAPATPGASDQPERKAKKLTPIQMFIDAHPVVKTVMIGLLLASVLSWTLLIIKLIEFAGISRTSDRFVEAFRGARSIADINRIATSEEFEGNPLADMAAAASGEVELSRQAGLSVTGEHRGTTIDRASQAIAAVQSSLAKRLSGGMQFLASTGSTAPFVGLFGTVYGIMNSFIGIANTNTTNLSVVAPGIAEALLATGIGLFAAIPAVVFYNLFQTRIAAFGTRSEGFVAELMNAISRQLDKGA